MTSQGVTKLMLTITRAYPAYKPMDMQGTAKLWMTLLQGYTDQEIAVALDAYIVSDTKGYPPAIGQIIDLVPKKDTQLSELEAWTLVNRAIRNGIYGAEEEFNKLPPAVRIAVGSPGQIRAWASTDVAELQTVAQSNFMRTYRAVVERERRADKMPPEIAQLFRRDAPIAQIANKEDTYRNTGVPMPEEMKERLARLCM